MATVTIEIEEDSLIRMLTTGLLVAGADSYVLASQRSGWMDEWYEYWPKGVKAGNYPVRSGLAECKSKMTKFRKRNPEITPEIILSATKNYIESFRKRDWAFIQTADYFIDKNGRSILAAYCDEAIDSLLRGDSPREEPLWVREI